MVEAEFAQIWQQLEHEATHEEDPEAARAEMEAEREDYHKIAERRVRLGLLLSEIGQRSGVSISDNEMNQLIMQAAQQYRPEDRQRFVEYVRNEPMAAAQIRAPLFEDKVVDYLFSQAEISERNVTRDVLQAEIESGETEHVHGPGCGHDHDHGAAKPKAKAKKAKAAAADEAVAPAAEEAKPAKGKKKAAAEPAAAAEPVEEKPAKKAKAKAAETAPAEVQATEAAAEKPAKKAKKAAEAPAAEAPAEEAKPAKKAKAKKTEA
jgi:trigger factor